MSRRACPRATTWSGISRPRTSRCKRVAFVPDGDLFKAISAGKASVVTDHIAQFDEKGIQLQSGDRIDCDVVVTATGFELSVMGDIPFSVDGRAVDFAQTVSYRGIRSPACPT